MGDNSRQLFEEPVLQPRLQRGLELRDGRVSGFRVVSGLRL